MFSYKYSLNIIIDCIQESPELSTQKIYMATNENSENIFCWLVRENQDQKTPMFLPYQFIRLMVVGNVHLRVRKK